MYDYTVFHTIAWPGAYAWYFFVAGIAAALFFFSALSWFRKELEPVRMQAAYGSLVALVVAGLLLVADLSQPQRFLYTLWPGYWNFTSPLVWGSIILVLFGLATVVYIYLSHIGNREQAKRLAVVGAVLAVALAVYTGFDLAVHQHRPVWSTPLMPVLFVALSLLSGAAVVSFLARGHEALMGMMRSFLLWSGGASALMILALLVTTAYGGSAEELTYMFMTSGGMGWLFIGVGIVLGLLVPLALLLTPVGKQSGSIMAASVLLLVGNMALRYAILLGPQTVHTYFS